MEDRNGHVPGDVDRGWTMSDLVVCITNFGLYPKSFGRTLQVFKQMVCVYVLNLKGSLLTTTVFVKLVNSRSWKECMIVVGKEEKY